MRRSRRVPHPSTVLAWVGQLGRKSPTLRKHRVRGHPAITFLHEIPSAIYIPCALIKSGRAASPPTSGGHSDGQTKVVCLRNVAGLSRLHSNRSTVSSSADQRLSSCHRRKDPRSPPSRYRLVYPA